MTAHVNCSRPKLGASYTSSLIVDTMITTMKQASSDPPAFTLVRIDDASRRFGSKID